MTSEIINDYNVIVNNIGKLIDVSGYKNEYVAKKIGIQATNFAMKKSKKSFSNEQIMKIIHVIENEDVDDFLMLELMRSRKNDENVSLADAKKELGWK